VNEKTSWQPIMKMEARRSGAVECRGNMVRCIECRLVGKTRDFPQVFLVAIPAAIRSLKSFAIIEIMKSRT